MVHRSRADREALRQATAVLEAGGRLLIMPEGGIDPELRDAMASGEERPFTEGMNSRLSAQLIEARPGALTWPRAARRVFYLSPFWEQNKCWTICAA